LFYCNKEENVDINLEECLPNLINMRLCFVPFQSIGKGGLVAQEDGIAVSLREVESLIDSSP